MNNWLANIAKNKKLRGEDYRVILLLLSEVKDGSVNIFLSQAEIAKKLDFQASNVCRCIAKLTREQIITKNKIGNKIIGYKLLI